MLKDLEHAIGVVGSCGRVGSGNAAEDVSSFVASERLERGVRCRRHAQV
jgi:hypothetical protein